MTEASILEIASAEPGTLRAGTRSEELRAKLEEMIVSAELQPGERLDEAELAARFKVSRTPVREALKALAAMGLVEVRGRQGVTVASISIPVLIEMFEMMAAMEGLCAKLAARRATVAQKAEMRAIHARLVEALEDGDPSRFYDINREFHEVLYDASHAQFIAQQTRALRKRVAAYRRYVTFQPGRMASTIGEHEKIMTAIEKADAEGAFKAASDHVMLLGDDMADFIAALPKGLMLA